MTTTFRAHFDGKVIVPDEPADLPVGRPLTLNVDVVGQPASPTTLRDQTTAFEELVAEARAKPVPTLPAEALRRENL